MKADPKNLLKFPDGASLPRATVEIRREVLARDGDCCRFCKAPGGASVLRIERKDFEHYVRLDTLMAHDSNTGEQLGKVPSDALPLGRSTRIVLDLAYLDGNPANVGRRGCRPNVAAACQRCNAARGRAAIERAEQDRLDAERESEFGPMLPLFG